MKQTQTILSNGKAGFRRVLHPEVKVIDAKKGLVQYVASDETVDSYREVVKASGWRFDHFKKNAPFVDSHDYSTVEKLVGKIVEFEVKGKKLVETAQWAIDVAENKLAQLGWKMTEAGYLKAVSVGFWPVKMVSRWDSNPVGYNEQLGELGVKADDANCPRYIFLEQQQIELSVCIIGANPNALAKAYKAGVLDDAAIDFIGKQSLHPIDRDNHAREAADAADASHASRRQHVKGGSEFLRRFETALKKV
jgi:hypothetical protein